MYLSLNSNSFVPYYLSLSLSYVFLTNLILTLNLICTHLLKKEPKYCSSKSAIFWDAMLCSPVEVHQHFWGIYCLHLQGKTVSRTRNWQKADGKHSTEQLHQK
jgi:hypothetical protein